MVDANERLWDLAVTIAEDEGISVEEALEALRKALTVDVQPLEVTGP